MKWGGALVCLLLMAAWGATTQGSVSWANETSSMAIAAGGGVMTYASIVLGSDLKPGWAIDPRGDVSFLWWFDWNGTGPIRYVSVPIWAFIVATLLPTVAAWRLDAVARRRHRGGLCPRCRYDRRGLSPTAPCPECGAASGHGDTAPH